MDGDSGGPLVVDNRLAGILWGGITRHGYPTGVNYYVSVTDGPVRIALDAALALPPGER